MAERARGFRRLLVDRNPIMPTGLLLFAIEYGKKDSEPLAGLFTAIRSRMHDIANGPLYDKLARVCQFRNTYIAHQKEDRELKDVELTRTALHEWIEALAILFEAMKADPVAATKS